MKRRNKSRWHRAMAKNRAPIAEWYVNFLDYYSSRFDLNRCRISSSADTQRSNSSNNATTTITWALHSKSRRAKVFYHFFQINSRLLASWFLLHLSFVRSSRERKMPHCLCENKTHTRNYIVRQKKARKRNVTGNFESNRIELHNRIW